MKLLEAWTLFGFILSAIFAECIPLCVIFMASAIVCGYIYCERMGHRK